MAAEGRGTRGGRARSLALLLAAAALLPWLWRWQASPPLEVGAERWVGLEREGTVRLYPLSGSTDQLSRIVPHCPAAPPVEAASRLLVVDACPLRVRALPLATRRLLGLSSDPNAVSVADLESLDGVGPQLARRIVAERVARGGYGSVEELDAVPGVGPARLATLRAALNPSRQ